MVECDSTCLKKRDLGINNVAILNQLPPQTHIGLLLLIIQNRPGCYPVKLRDRVTILDHIPEVSKRLGFVSVQERK